MNCQLNQKHQHIIEVYLCVPNHFVKCVNVSPWRKISVLNTFFSTDEKVFIFRGQLLDITQPFSFYGFHQNEYVVVLSKNYNSSSSTSLSTPTTNDSFGSTPISLQAAQQKAAYEYEKYKWIQITSDNESFIEKVSVRPTKKTSGEYARLRDLKIMKLEQKKNFWSKRINSYFEHEGISGRMDAPLVIDFPPCETPCSEAMPILW